MEDVAKLSGLSRVTVSKVLNGRDVKTKTRDLVLSACRELNFVTNQHAATLARGGSRLMGLVLRSITDPFYGRIIEMAEQTATELGFDLAYRCSYGDPEQERRVAETFLGLKSVALIVSPASTTDNVPFWKDLSTRLPVVFIDHATMRSCHLVATDHHRGARLVTEHLLRNGPNPAYLGSTEPLTNSAIAARRQGYIDTVSDAGQEPNILPTSSDTEQGDTEQFGYDSIKMYLRSASHRARPLRSLACATDAIALGAMSALVEAGLEPGRDVLVAGHDDLPFSAFSRPPLTTVRQHRGALGQESVRAAIELLDMPSFKSAKRIKVTLAPELIVRRSTLGYAHHGE